MEVISFLQQSLFWKTNMAAITSHKALYMYTAEAKAFLFTFYGPPGILSSSSLHFVDDSFFTAANHRKWNLFLQLNIMTRWLVKML